MTNQELNTRKYQLTQNVIDHFDFQKVADLMKHMGRTWFDEQPTAIRLEALAMTLCRNALKEWQGEKDYVQRVSSGGLEVAMWFNELSLRFVAVEQMWHTER